MCECFILIKAYHTNVSVLIDLMNIIFNLRKIIFDLNLKFMKLLVFIITS